MTYFVTQFGEGGSQSVTKIIKITVFLGAEAHLIKSYKTYFVIGSILS